MRISDWSSDVCSSDLFSLILPASHPAGEKGFVMTNQIVINWQAPFVRHTRGPRASMDRTFTRSARKADGWSGSDLAIEASNRAIRTEAYTSELQSIMRKSFPVSRLNKKT